MGLIRHFFGQRIANGFARHLAGALMLLAFSGLAEAQSSCTSTAPSANAVFVRAEGTAEQVADLTFSCSASGVSGTASISVYLSPTTSITSKILNSATAETEALAVTSAGQMVRGIVSGNSVSFNSLPFPAGAFSVTITDIRVNASQLASASGFPTGVSETIFVGGTNIVPAVLAPALTVAYVAPSLSQTNASNTTYPACSNLTPASGPVFTVPFAESFPSAFKTQGGAGNNVLGSEFTANTETGFYENDSGTTNQANSGTRIRVVFTNVPGGVGLYVPVTLTGTGQTATTPTARLTTTEAGAFNPYGFTSGAGIPSSPQMAQLAVNSGSAEAVYEITSQDPDSYDSFEVPVYLNASSATLTTATTPITATINMAPVGSNNIPNFAAANSLTFTATASSSCSFTIAPVSLPASTQNASYSQQLTAGPGSGALTWSVSTGSLPTGVTLNSVSGLLSGTPTASGSFAFTAKVVDQGSDQALQQFTLQVNAVPTGGATTCSNAAGNPNLIRAEGLSEQVGDLTFTCSGGGGSATIKVALSPTLSITSKVLAPSGGATEAVAITSVGSVQGIITGSEVSFNDVPLPAGTSTVTITNIRVNAAALTGNLPITVNETAFVSGAYVTPAFVSNGNVPVAYVLPGLAQTSVASATYSACTTLTPASGPAFVVRFGENFPSAFKTQGGSANSTPGSEFTSNTETGFFETVSGISNLANSGTRIRVVFTNVPAGVGVYVPATLTGTGQTTTVPMLQLTSSEAGAFRAVAGYTGSGLPASPALVEILIFGGTGEAVYEVMSQDPNSLESFAVPVYLSGTSAALSGASGPITALAALAPVGASIIPSFGAVNFLTVSATASATCVFSISPSSLPNATEGASYSQPLIAGPGNSALTWSISAGSLPAGLSLDPVAGLLSGAPTATGSFNFTAKAVDQSSDVASQQFTLQVSPPIVSSGFSSTCTPNTSAVFVRAEGVTERVADTTLSCTGGGGTVTLQVFINPQFPITSKVLSAGGTTEAMAVTSSGSVQGVVNGSSMVFYGVQVPAGSSTVTITNIRVNASASNFSGGAPSAVSETSVLYGPASVSTVLATTYAGYITNGLATPTISGVTNYSLNSPIITFGSPSFLLTAAGNFPDAFKTQAQETGTPIGSSNAASSGTRIEVLFQHVPAGLGVLVPISLTSSNGGDLTLTASETGPFSAVPSLPNAGTGLAQVTTANGTGMATYEVTASSGTTDSYSIPVYLNTPNGVTTASAPITTTVSLGPLNAPSNIPDFILPASDTPLTGSGFTTTLSSGIAGVPYGPVTVPVSGGVAPYTFSAASLPSGLAVSSAGVVTGTPAAPTSGLFAGSVLITDSTGAAFTSYLGIRILPVLAIATSSLPAAPLNVAYSQMVAAQGGTPSYTFSVPANALPPGLSLNTSTGAITGTPTQPGTYSFTITVTDSGTVGTTGLPAQVASQTFQIIAGLAISSTEPLYPAFINAPYSTALTSSGGTGAVTWSISAGALPAGITLVGSTGAVSGSPTVAGIYSFTAEVTDSTTPTPQAQTHQYSLMVAQQYVVSTIAGGAPPVTPQPALNASIGIAGTPAVDSANNIYFVSFNSVMKVDTSGNMTRVAGNGRPGYSGDGGPAINAQIFDPAQIALDGAGNLYIADSGNLRVRKVSSATGIITTIAGGTPLDLVGLQGVAVDGAGNIYFTDTIHLNKLSPAGVRTNYFNANFIQFPGGPGAISADSAGNIYFTDSAAVYKVSPAGVQTTVAGTPGTTGYSGDGGPATAAVLWFPRTPVIDSAGNLFIYDSGNGRIREIATNGTITTAIGPVAWNAVGVARDSQGNFYASSYFNPGELALLGFPASRNWVTKLSPGGVVSAFAGNGHYESLFASRVTLDSTGYIYFSDPEDSAIGEISPIGTYITGFSASSPQGLGAQVLFAGGNGNPALDYVFYADAQKNEVLAYLPPLGCCGVLAGTGTAGFSGEGSPAGNAQLSGPTDIVRDPAGNFYIADTGNNRIRTVDNKAVIATYAGTGSAGFSGDGSPATTAQLNGPSGVALYGGNLYIADTGNNRVRMVGPTGSISTVAGGGNALVNNGGPAVNARLNAPTAISLDSQGNLYIVDQSYSIWQVTTDGVIHDIAGTGSPAYSGDGGPATSAAMAPTGIAVGVPGTIYVANDRYLYGGDGIRVLTPSTAAPLIVQSTTLPPTAAGASGYSAAPAATGGTGSYTWSVLPQALPPGLSLNSATGVITGTPGAAGFYDFTVTVTDSGTVALTGTSAQTVSQSYRITVNSALALSAAALPVATTNVAYSTSLILATGGTPSYTYSIISGSLPNGLSLASSGGAISGAASVAGSYSFTVQVTDSGTTPRSVMQTYQLTVQAPPIISTASLPAGAVGSVYSATVNVTPGTTPYTFSLTPDFGTLPAGLSLNSSTGTISGTPTATGSSSFTVAVTDGGTPPFTVSRSLSITVYSAITITSFASLPIATATAPYLFALQAMGGASSSYVWSATGLPSWLSLASGGVLSGTPPSAGSVPVNLNVTDGVQTVQATLTLLVNAPTGQTWTQLTPGGPTPAARFYHTAILDAAAQQMIVFGGLATDPPSDFNDVWSYSIAGNTWNQLTPVGAAPPARYGSAAVYSPAHTSMVEFGGYSLPLASNYSDTWVLTNATAAAGTPTWTQLLPSETPPARRFPTAVYDPASNRMIVFGGYSGTWMNDVWVLAHADSTGGTPAWTQLSPSGAPPSGRISATATYDPSANTMILFGGTDSNGIESDVWLLSNANGLGGTPAWTQQSPSGGPVGPHSGQSAILDIASNRMVIFSGSEGSGPIVSSDTWVLSNANGAGAVPAWSQLAPLGTLPPARAGHSAVYEASSNNMLIFGGAYGIVRNDLWSLSDANGITSITSLSPASMTAGGGAFTLTVNGQGFAPGAVVQWNGAALVTTFVSSTQLTAAVPATDVTAQASVNVTVQNPALAASVASPFTITAAVSTSGGGGGGGAPPPSNPLSVSPASLTFNVPAGAVASTQTIALSFPTFTQGAPGFSASFNTNQGSGWLSVSPSSGTMTQQSLNGLLYTYGATIMVSVNPANVPAGSSFTGTVNLSASGGIVSVPITMNVNSQPAKFTAAPTVLTFSSQAGSTTLPATQSLAVFSTPTGASFTASASTTSGGNWLAISPSSGGVAPASFTVSANTAGLAAGSYPGQIAITGGAGTPLDVPVSLTVAPAQPPKISVSPSNPTFMLTQGAGSTAGQIAVSNAGGGTLQFSAAASSSPSGWLQLAGSGSGSATSSSPASQGFTVNPAGLSPGAYSGQITLTDTASNTDQATVAITLAVSQSSQSLSLSQSGLTFSGVQNGPAPPTQSFALTSAGQGSLPWNASANMLSGEGSGWLSVTPSSGSATGGQTGSPVTVTVNQAGLTPGQYYGSVGVSAQNAANSPQTISVLLSVGASGTANTGPAVSTGALVFTGPAGGTAPPSQRVNIFNPASSADSYTVSAVTSDGAAWLSIGSAGGTLNSGSNSLSVSTGLTGIAAGVHTGTIALAFGSGGTATIQVVLIATASSGSAVSGLRPQVTFTSACSGGKPGYLVPVFAAPASQQSIQAGQANLLRVYLFDDCGDPVTASEGGVVQVDFGDGDAPVNLHDTGNGIWEGTWIPINAAAQVTLTAIASEGSLPSIGATVAVTLLAAGAGGAGVPGGIVNAGSQAAAIPGVVTPGSYITIYGSNLAGNGQGSASTIPLPFSLNGTQATIGNRPMPLLYAGPTQINALVPQSLNPNESYPLVIQNGSTQSVPVPLTLVSPQPAVYTANLSGSGQGVVEIAGTTLLAAPLSTTSRPAIRGTDFLVIYCTGLGPVQGSNGGEPPADGAAAPSTEVFQTADNVTVTIGGISGSAAFAGLTPTLVGLYQINVRVPAGAASGGAVPLFVTVTNPQTGIAVTSNTVTVALQ